MKAFVKTLVAAGALSLGLAGAGAPAIAAGMDQNQPKCPSENMLKALNRL